MTAVGVPAAARPAAAKRRQLHALARLLRLELRRNVMPLILPVAVGLFWFTSYRKAMAMPPLWGLRAASIQTGAVAAFVCPVTGAAAWMGSREARRRTIDLVTITARPQWARQLATWAATASWAIAGWLVCAAVVYGVTDQQAAWGGPLWWPVAVVAASLVAMSALGFAAGALVPSRFTAPVVAIAAFFVLALATQPIEGSHSYWQISPLVSTAWDIGPDPSLGTFYPYLPDLAIAQLMFLAGFTVAVLAGLALANGSAGTWARRAAAVVTTAGLLAAGTAVALAGTAHLDRDMIAIPALHDAANDRPLHYTPVCSRTAVPVCLNPAFTIYLPAVAAALAPVLKEVAGLPGAPTRISQVAASYQQVTGNDVSVGLPGPDMSGTVFPLVLPDQVPAPAMTPSEVAAAVRGSAGLAILGVVINDGRGATGAQRAVAAALRMAVGLPEALPSVVGRQLVTLPLPAGVQAAARRFAALSASARHGWLAQHLTALRAGRVPLAQLP